MEIVESKQVCKKIDGASLIDYPFVGFVMAQPIQVEFELAIEVFGRGLCRKDLTVILLKHSVRFRLMGKIRVRNQKAIDESRLATAMRS
jgi:hypothetical protein